MAPESFNCVEDIEISETFIDDCFELLTHKLCSGRFWG